ncbi:BMP family ABC transporter substrate-binding protein [Phytohalomonas tamaricis]|uniref:BMP family ABC transporter substrate-binding protein n=1 Tax=Phytohalomonas tamaricis TaxID=2081032 RepID=UPI000D0B6A63|nr:BMP family ABC transporter substrate-binding protein [Phytohalomonas tamaricis]
MYKKIRKPLWLLALFISSHATANNSTNPLQMSFMYGGPVSNPVGWIHGHEIARKQLEKEFSGGLKTRYVEKVLTTTAASSVIHQLSRQSSDIVVGASFDFMNPIMQAAKQNPNTIYLCASCYKQAPNVGNYLASTYQGRYIAGILAGYMSKTGIAAYIGSYPLPEVIRDINAFLLGMRTVNPKAILRVTWLNTWDDPQKEMEAVTLMVAQGADVVTAHNDSASVVMAAERAHVYSVGYGSDMRKYGPKGQLTAIVQNWEPYFRQSIDAVRSGAFKGGDYWGDVVDGIVTLSPFNDAIPQEAQDKALAMLEKLRQRQRDVFVGPISNQAGKVVVPAGMTLGHKELARMDYFVEGINGSLQ